VYLLHVRYPSTFDKDAGAENTTLAPMPVSPMPRAEESPDAHRGDGWLQPGARYTFTFDASPFLTGTGAREYWLRLEYRGDLYAPQGQARIKINSRDLYLPERNN
jgi:hypothetical protein